MGALLDVCVCVCVLPRVLHSNAPVLVTYGDAHRGRAHADLTRPNPDPRVWRRFRVPLNRIPELADTINPVGDGVAFLRLRRPNL